MHRMNNIKSKQNSHNHGPRRTYQQISDILSQREGTQISAAAVKQICDAAESKLVDAMMADLILYDWLCTSEKLDISATYQKKPLFGQYTKTDLEREMFTKIKS